MAKTLGSLPVGALVKDTGTKYYGAPIVWKIADKNHAGYPANSVTLITDQIITLKCFDGKEPANSDEHRKNYGNNRYIYANMRRWLNSPAGAGAWYAAQHSADAPPNAAAVDENPYDTQAGFLNTFGSDFLNALLTTTLTVARNTVTDGGSYETLTDKLFLASNTEVGLANENNIVEGAKLALFTDNASRIATLTAEAVSNGGNGWAGGVWYWWLRTPCEFTSYMARFVNYDGTLDFNSAEFGNYSVRPLCNLLSSILVSDTTDSDGCYRIFNRAPTAPTTINVPTSIYENKSAVLSWTSATDPDGDALTYKLERALNGGVWTQLYSGGNLSFSDSITPAMNTLQYRVKAVDTASAESAYTTSPTVTVIHNSPPGISGTDTDIGAKSTEVSYQYTITDVESDTVTVTEKLDNTTLRTYSPALGGKNTLTVDVNAFTALSNARHTLTITAIDSEKSQSTRTITFTKQSDGFSVVLVPPISAETQPKRVNLLIKRSIPDGALFKAEVCNNPFDSVPVWEDATKSIFQNTAHVFANKTQHALQAGLNIRVTVSRNAAKGECWVSEIAGNFE